VNRPEIKPPAVDDFLHVIDRAAASRNPENALVFRLFAATGSRRGEVCDLQWRDIGFDAEPVRVLIRRAVLEIEKKLIVQGTKTHAVRSVGLDEEMAAMLREHRARSAELGLRSRIRGPTKARRLRVPEDASIERATTARPDRASVEPVL